MARKKSVRKSSPAKITYGKWKLSQWVVTYSILGFVLYYLVYMFLDKGWY